MELRLPLARHKRKVYPLRLGAAMKGRHAHSVFRSWPESDSIGTFAAVVVGFTYSTTARVHHGFCAKRLSCRRLAH